MKYRLVVMAVCLQTVALTSCLSHSGDPSAGIAVSDSLQTPGLHNGAISGPCLVFNAADSLVFDSLEKAIGEEDFATVADDCGNYFAEAQQFADSMDIVQVHTEGRSLRFRLKDGSIREIPMTFEESPYAVFLFRGDSLPVKADPFDEISEIFHTVFPEVKKKQ